MISSDRILIPVFSYKKHKKGHVSIKKDPPLGTSLLQVYAENWVEIGRIATMNVALVVRYRGCVCVGCETQVVSRPRVSYISITQWYVCQTYHHQNFFPGLLPHDSVFF